MYSVKKQTVISGLVPWCNSSGSTNVFWHLHNWGRRENASGCSSRGKNISLPEKLVRSSLDPTQKKYLSSSCSQCSGLSLFTICWESLSLLCSHSNEKYHCWELMFKKDKVGKKTIYRKREGDLDFYKIQASRAKSWGEIPLILFMRGLKSSSCNNI